MDYAAYARVFGFKGIKVTNAEDVASAWDEAFAHPGVTLLDFYTDKNVPPLPPHISHKYALNTDQALLKGDPNEWGVVKDSTKALVTEGVQRAKEALHIGRGKGQAGGPDED